MLPMENPSSPLDTLRQLKEMLDAGALTPAEFEALKQRLVFGPAAPTAGAAPEPPTPTPVPAPPTAFDAPLLPPVPASPAPFDAAEPAGYVPAYDAASAPLAAPTGPPEPAAYAPVAAAPEPLPAPTWPATERPEPVVQPARSPLGLVLGIGGVLALLAIVFYLSMNRHPSERLSSTSQTAADSVAAAIETGPQAAPMPQAAVPETLRLVPPHPAPPVGQPRPTPASRDSAAAPLPATAADSATRP